MMVLAANGRWSDSTGRREGKQPKQDHGKNRRKTHIKDSAQSGWLISRLDVRLGSYCSCLERKFFDHVVIQPKNFRHLEYKAKSLPGLDLKTESLRTWITCSNHGTESILIAQPLKTDKWYRS